MTQSAKTPVLTLLWAIAAFVLAFALARTLRVEWSYLPGSAPPRVEDRRSHRFRNFKYSQADRMLRHLVRQAEAAQNPRDRAIALARVATLQQERGFLESAQRAGQEALQLTERDPQVSTPIWS